MAEQAPFHLCDACAIDRPFQKRALNAWTDGWTTLALLFVFATTGLSQDMGTTMDCSNLSTGKHDSPPPPADPRHLVPKSDETVIVCS